MLTPETKQLWQSYQTKVFIYSHLTLGRLPMRDPKARPLRLTETVAGSG
jgi:hypothetical protein